MSKLDKLRQWKESNVPASGVCPECKQFRGHDLKVWTLLPNHMYCKYCFIHNVADKEEQKRLRTAFLTAFKASDDFSEMSDSNMIKEILDIVRMLVPSQATLLNDQFLGSDAGAREHLKARMQIRSAPSKIGRYLIGPELEGIWGDRVYELIEAAPMSLMRGMKAILTTPGVMSAHRDMTEVPNWLTKAMKPFTTVVEEYPNYPAAYVQALAKGL